MNTTSSGKPLAVLIILDGLGVKESKVGNAVLAAKTPTLDALWTTNKHALLKAAGKEVGLSQGDPGNSEVGHLNLGAGQIVYQSLPRIDEHIRTGKFAEIPALQETFKEQKKRKSKLHIMGLLSATGIHAHIEHLFELMDICEKKRVEPYIHVILDGRDTGLKDGYLFLSMLKAKISESGGTIASICGRRFSMDRDNKWERTEAAYNAMVGKGERTATEAMEVLQDAYAAGENDQIFTPTTMVDDSGKPVGPVEDNDVMIFYNFREDRARQITKAFALDELDSLKRDPKAENIYFLAMMGYEDGLPVQVLFEAFTINTTLSSIISDAGMTQLHIGETEKYAHVTYFFNGGVEKPHEGEEFFNIPSPKVFDYDEVPEMSAYIIRDEAVNRIRSGKYNFVMMNFANPDMLGHTGNFEATVKGIEVCDECVKDVVTAIYEMGGGFVLTADHGNSEEMVDEVTGEVNTAHTNNSVPVILSPGGDKIEYPSDAIKIGTGEGAVERGIIADIAPTILGMLGLEPSSEMTGIDLFKAKM
jgi:2,3-bisphosphoglycerate-independent phosphoglycerate mutase